MARPELIEVAVALPFQGVGDAVSSEAITPGHIVENVAAGTCRKNTRVAAGTVPRRIALQNREEGKTIDDVWASGARVKFQDFMPGDIVQLVLKAGVNAANEALLRVDNTGCVTTAGSNAPYAYSVEALDLSASGAVDTHILARLL